MKISIITPSYNQGRFIKACFSSVKNQNIEVEHIILDNCSTDMTKMHLASYISDPGPVNVRAFIEADGGQTQAINKGFSLARGEILSWLNTDEWYESGALNKVLDFFEENPEVDIVFGDCNYVDSEKNILRTKKEFFFSRSMLLYYGCYLPSCATFVRRKIIDDGFFLDNNFKVTMDFEWYMRLADSGYKFSHLPAVLTNFTWHESNISSVYSERRRLERNVVQDRYCKYLKQNIVREIFFSSMKYFWMAVRVARRWVD